MLTVSTHIMQNWGCRSQILLRLCSPFSLIWLSLPCILSEADAPQIGRRETPGSSLLKISEFVKCLRHCSRLLATCSAITTVFAFLFRFQNSLGLKEFQMLVIWQWNILKSLSLRVYCQSSQRSWKPNSRRKVAFCSRYNNSYTKQPLSVWNQTQKLSLSLISEQLETIFSLCD